MVTEGALLVSAFAHFGFILATNDAISIVAGITALVATLWQHYSVKSANKEGIAAGIIVPKKG